MSRYIVVSADAHAGARLSDYRPYLEERYGSAFDEWIARKRGEDPLAVDGVSLVSPEVLGRFRSEEAVQSGGLNGSWDPAQRIQEMDAEGIAADVIFPDVQNHNQPPFDPLDSPGSEGAELQMAGARAYNRWLADFCSENRDRFAGVAVIPTNDVEAAVTEIRLAKTAGLQGVLIPTISDEDPRPVPQYLDAHYDPIWATCQELALPVHVHKGRVPAIYGKGKGSTLIYLYEQLYFHRRLFANFVWGGFFERFPRLRFVMVDQGSQWIEEKVLLLDWRAHGPLALKKLPLKPSEYWLRNCWVTVPAMERADLDARSAIGVHKVMWGSHYPEVEGTWPHTRERLRDTFAGVPEREVRAILGETAIRVYEFGRSKLEHIAEQIGPSIRDFMPAAALV